MRTYCGSESWRPGDDYCINGKPYLIQILCRLQSRFSFKVYGIFYISQCDISCGALLCVIIIMC